MKNVLRGFSILFAASLASVAYAGSVPSFDVTVSNGAGKVGFKGKTRTDGSFATEKLEPGNYVVQLHSTNAMKGQAYMVVVGAGKKKVSTESVPGEKFAAGGVAMKIDVGAGTNIAGQITDAQQAGAQGNSKVKIIKGKRYVWQGPETGSNTGGRWVEEGTVSINNVSRGGTEVLGGLQERAQSGSGSGR